MLNHGVVIARSKQPHLNWAVGLDGSRITPDAHGYLIPGYEDDEEVWRMLEVFYPRIFENELYGCHTYETARRRGRDFAMLKA
jgi:hypothetical protein